MPERIAILGTGLIGASLGLAWKEYDADLTLVGYDQREEARETARERGAVDQPAADPAVAAQNADLVVLATPLPAMMHLLEAIAPALDADATVTDVGSVKRPVMEQAREALPEATFIGGHPMAGSEQSGPRHARAGLFREAAYVLCPGEEEAGPDAFADEHERFIELIEATGARIEIMPAARHDRSVAALSHLPQLLAVALANQAGADENAARLAGPGLRDMTRLAASRFDLWKSILMANQSFVLDALSQLGSQLQRISNRLAGDDLDALETLFEEARHARTDLSHGPRDLPDASPADLHVEAQNRPGELFRITKALYEADLNVMDIEFLTVRGSADGVFRVGFSEEAKVEAARRAVEEAGFTTR
jgi:prephenate dehydrogenase